MVGQGIDGFSRDELLDFLDVFCEGLPSESRYPKLSPAVSLGVGHCCLVG